MLYNDIPAEFEATRYHSLVIDRNTISNKLMITAELNDKTIMGIRHRKYPVFGVQYHPESIETKHGKKIIKNFIFNV
jgi:anthranilate synthase component 2